MLRERLFADADLSPREWQILEYLRDGVATEAIAEQLGISKALAETQVQETLARIGIQSRHHLSGGSPVGLAAVLPGMTRHGRASFLRMGAVLFLGASFALLLAFFILASLNAR